MSRLGRTLAAEFDAEFSRLANDWFLKWHALGRGEPIEVDDFRGGVLRPSSKTFDAVAQLVYWSAVKYYIENKTSETFTRIEQHIGLQTGERAARTAEEGAIALRAFLERLHRHAVFTEYRLKARGYPDERHLASRRDDSIVADVQRRKVALLAKCGGMSWTERIAEALGGRVFGGSPLSTLLLGGAIWLAAFLLALAGGIAYLEGLS
jgi:hypothetical protein